MNQGQHELQTISILVQFASEAQERQTLGNPLVATQQVLSWTHCQPALVQSLCQLILQGEVSLKAGEEMAQVERLVQTCLIEGWENHEAAEPIREIRDRAIDNPNCSSFALLETYRNILEQTAIAVDESPEQQELLNLGLIIQSEDRVKITNPIYERVFNRLWVKEQLAALCPYAWQLDTWLKSNAQDESKLLVGQTLKDAIASTQGRALSEQEHRFLIASQVVELRRA